ncbi:Lrp/AsnC family transcriptional regulator [Rhizobium sp. BK376]|uniref:Lrp/AsnC family transcriptional regulator n=1 Tax=Rhizobium sp. BK376 TaxID=2512149 RepID=UPI00104EA9FC|nr:Lrp/AsnC family transcriptional regulator [Rhizobium sp. BK376]TCR80868.1 AsnC family transcriptional regulator [Rhizobium sp. BK376]
MLHTTDLDVFDQKIISELTANGRLSWRDLAEKIGLSLSPTIRRVRRLEQSGIIRGYYAAVDQSRLQGAIGVFIHVALEHQVREALALFERSVEGIAEIVGGYQITGSSDYLIHAMVRDLPHYQKLLDSLTSVEGVSKIQSNFVVKTFVHRPLPA